jgi:gliding motility-associated-like protein
MVSRLKYFLFSSLLFHVSIVFSQTVNLVPNPSFEQFTFCPTSISQLSERSIDWSTVSPGSVAPGFSGTALGGTSDLYNSCYPTGPITWGSVGVPTNISGFQTPYDGNGYAGIITYQGDFADGTPPAYPDYREYLMANLSSPMLTGETYKVSFYWSAANNRRYVADGLGVHFSATPPSPGNNLVLPVTPQITNTIGNILQDTVNWNLFTGTFVATQAHEFITIGNFNDDNSTTTAILNPSPTLGALTVQPFSYYYIDSVSVVCQTCPPDLEACVEVNGDITVASGIGPYSWDDQTLVQNCVSCAIGCNFPAGCSFFDPTWSFFSNSTTITPPSFPLQVTDNTGAYLLITDPGLLPACTICDATVTAAGPFCEDAITINLYASQTGGTWSGTGITDVNAGTFDPATAGAGVHIITYTLGCGDTDNINITVNATDDSTFAYTSANYCLTDIDPSPTISGLAGGTFTIDNSGSINTGTGVIDITASGTGTYNITYTTNGPCPTIATEQVIITATTDATVSAVGAFCVTDPAINLVAVDAGGLWSGTGITNGTTGTFDPSIAGVGTHTITYAIAGSCGDTDNINIVVNQGDDSTFTYSSGNYCLTDTDPTPVISGVAGGTFTIDNGGVINVGTGEVDITTSGAGTYNITYTTNGPCPTIATEQLIITATSDATITAAGPFCATDPVVNLIAVDGGGSWSGTGITDANLGTFDPATAGAYTITYTISGSCGDIDNINITVIAVDDATFTYPSTTYCTVDVDPLPAISGTIGGTFAIDNGGTINTTTGEIDLDVTGDGTYTVTYTTNGLCPASATFNIAISGGSGAVISPAGPYCIYNQNDFLTASISAGTWSGDGIIDPATGEFDPSLAGLGTHTISYMTTGNCGTVATYDITVNDSPIADIDGPFWINWGENVQMNATGGSTYIWTPDEYLSCNDCADPIASPLSSTEYCVIAVDNGCLDTACAQVLVNLDCGNIYVPNAFTPNSGDVNGLECVMGGCLTYVHMRIYDRWGEIVFETNDKNDCWDGTHKRNGKPMSTAVFVYTLTATKAGGEKVEMTGNISLVR